MGKSAFTPHRRPEDSISGVPLEMQERILFEPAFLKSELINGL